MNNKRLLFLSMVAMTLCIGVIIGTIVSGGVKATFQEKPATIVIPDPVSLSNAFSQIAAQLEPAVVSIVAEPPETTRVQRRQAPRNPAIPPGLEDLFNQFGGVPGNPPRPSGGSGTGFVVDKAGYILTNHHVIDGAGKIMVHLSDGSSLPAKVVGSDEATDVGLIKVEANHPLAVAKFGNSDAVKVGDWVLAIGSPFGFDHTVTSGIISAKGRPNARFGAARENWGLQRFLQTDAAINPGNSGGPLVNMSGEVIGINTAIVSGTASFAGLGFALPSNTAVGVYNQLSQTGKVSRGSIGILYSSVKDPNDLEALNVTTKEAIIVEEVYPGTPAEKAGLRKNDIITEINGVKVSNGDLLLETITATPIGSTIRLGFVRNGRSQTVSVAVGDRTEIVPGTESAASNVRDIPSRRNSPTAEATSRLGFSAQGVTAQMSRQFPGLSGVEITKVESDSPADDAGLEEGMVVTGFVMGGRASEITNMADFRAFESQLKSGTSVMLMLKVPDEYSQTVRISMKVK